MARVQTFRTDAKKSYTKAGSIKTNITMKQHYQKPRQALLTINETHLQTEKMKAT
jgi:adenylylsulfate kinase-like enzyme